MSQSVPGLLLEGETKLVPANACAAIIRAPGERYLLQHRDARADIFYPDHWGFFGGACEAGEQERQALVREIGEELNLTIAATRLDFFSRFHFDLGFAGGDTIYRAYYLVTLEPAELANVRLGEGQNFAAVTAAEALGGYRMTPYDSFALWLHVARHRLAFPPERQQLVTA